MHGETREVPASDTLDWSALAAYLRWHLADEQIPGLRLGEAMEVSQFHGGHTNLTYLIRFGGAELVLRRAPLGPRELHAHDMAREHRWLTALHPVFPLAPRPYLLCEDLAVVGCVFSIIERRRGFVIRKDEPMQLDGHPARRQQVSESLVDTLALLHQVDITRDTVAALGRPIGFLDRQVRSWRERWAQARVDPTPVLDAVALWLVAHQPPDSLDPTVVHGDFALDNVLLDPLEPARVTAVLDWERAALGDPLVDLGILLAHWTPLAGPEQTGQALAVSTVTGRPGYLSRDQLIARYARQSGRDVSAVAFYEVLALFMLVTVLQQRARRFRETATDDPRRAALDDKIQTLAARAQGLTRTSPRRGA